MKIKSSKHMEAENNQKNNNINLVSYLIVSEEQNGLGKNESKTVVIPNFVHDNGTTNKSITGECDTKDDAGDPLARTKSLFGGLVNDIRRRYPNYPSDIFDGLNVQCVAAIVFIAFAQISGSIAFGGLMGSKTDNIISIIETVLTSSVAGIIFALFSGQPLLIVATTGPMLLFDESLFTFCMGNEINFLAMRAWIGCWLAVIALIFVAFELSFLVRFVSRFTQEIFSSLISLLFIAESLEKLVRIHLKHPIWEDVADCDGNESILSDINGTWNSTDLSKPPCHQPNVALLFTILITATFYVAWTLMEFRSSTFLNKTARDTIANFCVPIAIAVVVLVDFLIKDKLTDKLDAPEGFRPTADRPWIVNPMSVHLGLAAGAALPALLLFILLFMEVSIAELIVSGKKLKKGSGFHLDILLMCATNTLLAFFGLPWASSPLVRGLAHVSALTVWNVKTPPGEKPRMEGIKEQRLTALVVSIFTGASVVMADALRLIPMAVLFGVFLFMGVASIAGIQFFERLALLFKQPKNYPLVPYAQQVPVGKMHAFTTIQIFWLAVLWGVKYTRGALSFPFILLILIPFRLFVLKHVFTPEELSHLDGDCVKTRRSTS